MMTLSKKLHHTLAVLAPELLTELQDERNLTAYLDSFLLLPGDPEETLCQTLSPSRSDFLSLVLEEEFPQAYLEFLNAGILPYELINLSGTCASIFEEYGFSGNETGRKLRYRIIGIITEYLKGEFDDDL